jgi:hypothetical protein
MEIPTPGRLRGIRARDTGTASAIRKSRDEQRGNPSPFAQEESKSIDPPSPEEVFLEESRYR